MARSRHLNEIELRYNYVRNPRYYATRIQAFVCRLLEEAELRFRVSMVHFYTARKKYQPNPSSLLINAFRTCSVEQIDTTNAYIGGEKTNHH